MDTGGMKSASGFDACGDWIRTLFAFIGDADLAFSFILVGVVCTWEEAVGTRGKLTLVGESNDWVRACCLDCLRGLGLGVASGGWGSVSVVIVVLSLLLILVVVEGESIAEVTTPGRLHFELTDAGVNGGAAALACF
jgi:hypothetical protein